jgi:hypothetical protein
MTHKPRHTGGTPGASGPPGRNYPVSKSSVNPYKQAAESMKSAGIKSLSGATTSDDKGKKAKKIQKDYQENQNKDSKPDKEKVTDDYKSDKLILSKDELRKKYADELDRPKSGGIMKKDDTNLDYISPFNLEYDMSLSGEIPGLMETGYSFSPMIQDETLQKKVERYIYSNIPKSLHNTVGASYAIVTAAVEQEYTFDSGVILDWKDDMTIMIDILKLLEDK